MQGRDLLASMSEGNIIQDSVFNKSSVSLD